MFVPVLLLKEFLMSHVNHFTFDILEAEECLVHVPVEGELNFLGKLEGQIYNDLFSLGLNFFKLFIDFYGQ